MHTLYDLFCSNDKLTMMVMVVVVVMMMMMMVMMVVVRINHKLQLNKL